MILNKLRYTLFGAPKNVKDPHIFHKMALVPLLAWIGLGADGLSSSSYGPEEAYKALGPHTYLALLLALATALTVILISYTYSKIIEYFPSGGGGYIVATHTLSDKAGVISGCALLVDYMLTITVSIVSCGAALFSFLPPHLFKYKLPFDLALILILILLNIRGVKESVKFLAPIFAIFILTHILLIGYGILSHIPQVAIVAHNVKTGFNSGLATLGGVGLLALFLRAYSIGGGTYTGIEAVANGMQIMSEPRVQSGKRTMLYMSVSLALTAGGLFVCYLLLNVVPSEGKTLNSILANALFGNWPLGYYIALITILSEGALLFVAAQAGFIDGPRVMSNMAIDSWFPHRFASLSEQLTMQNGVLLMGGASIFLLFYTKGDISKLIVMYSINVFLGFSLSQLGMSTFFIRNRKKEKHWKKHLAVHIIGFLLCFTILIVTSYEKFSEGGWITFVITASFVTLCYLIRAHYRKVRRAVKQLDVLLTELETSRHLNTNPVDPYKNTAIQLVSGYSGFGVHTFLSIIRSFPKLYENYMFISVAVVDSGAFKGLDEVKNLEKSVEDELKKYVELARKFGFAADYRMITGTDVVQSAVQLCKEVKQDFSKSTVFSGKLVFRRENFLHNMLHNQTAFAIQSKLHWDEITSVILPIRLTLDK